VAPEDFAAAVRGLAKAGFAGANVTIPHKEAAFAVCDVVEDFARRAGAVNTLVFTPRGIEGRNTDGYGFIANLRAHGVEPAVGPALILGAGGAARAIAAALVDAGARVFICNRSTERALAVASALPDVKVLKWKKREEAVQQASLLVNTTSLGMVGNPPLEMSLENAPPWLAVADIVYAPLKTPLLTEATARGLRTVEGLGMLLHQAVPGFEAWFGVTPVVDDELYRIAAG